MDELKKLLENAGMPVREGMSHDELKDWIDHGLATTSVGSLSPQLLDDIADYLMQGDIVSAIQTAMQDYHRGRGNNRSVEADLHGVFSGILQQGNLGESEMVSEKRFGSSEQMLSHIVQRLRQITADATRDPDQTWDDLMYDLDNLIEEIDDSDVVGR